MALTPFEQEFKSQRELLGPGKTFTFKGKEYTTDYAKPKTESNRGGARMKSGKDIMDTLPKVGKVDRSELEDYDITPKQTKGFKAEDMGMNQYKKPELDDFIPTKKAIPGSFDNPMSDLPGRFPTRDQRMEMKKGGKVDFSQIIRNKKTGVLSMKKAEGGMVKAKRTSNRGAGIAVKGFGRAGGR
jgi:hypothetical protein